MRYREFFLRPVSWARNLDIYADSVTPDDMPSDMAYFFELYQDCFQHHVQPRLQSSGEELVVIIDESRKRKIQQDALTAYFLKKIYIANNISYSPNSSTIDQLKHPKLLDEFVQEVIGSPIESEFPKKSNNPGTNRVSFLIGDVGVGKSLLTSRCISLIDEINKQRDDTSHYVLPVYIDFDLVLKDENDALRDITEDFIAIITTSVQNLLERNELWKDEYSDLQPGNAYQKFIRLNHKLLRNRIRIFLIFDNTDRYHFYYSKYSFYEPYRKEQTSKVKRNFTAIFNMISRVEYLGDQALAVLFVCRKSVLKYWIATGRPEDNQRPLSEDYGVYQIQKIDELVALKSRFRLAEKAIEAIEKVHPAKSKQYLAHMRLIESKLELSLSDQKINSLNLIRRLTHHGTRSMIDFLGSLRIDFRTQYDLVLRLFEEQPHNLLRLYITNINKRYAQFSNHFPNIFLVDAVVATNDAFPELHLPHIHTYWLKYLVLKYIVTKHGLKEITTYNELKERFVDACGYEPHLFDLALGSLNAVNSFRCIEIDEDSIGMGGCVRVFPTSRGITLLSNDTEHTDTPVEFCFDFNYLQFVVDDPQLSHPSPYARKIFVEEDIGYIMSSSPAYRAGLGSYLKAKSKSVLHFLHVLNTSSRFEISNRLHKDKYIAALLPDFTVIFNGLFTTYSTILKTHVPSGEHTLQQLETLHESLMRDQSIIEFYLSYGDNKCLVEQS